jgi:hypothetical protein
MKHLLFFLLLLPISAKAQYIDLVQFIASNHGDMADSLITQLAFDSLVDASSREADADYTWDFGSFHSSDDGLLKIYHFAGEGCGAYCNPFYRSIVSVGNAKYSERHFHDTEEVHCDIDSIVTLVEGQFYLLFGNHSGRPRGVEGVWGESVFLCSIEEGFEVIWHFASSTSSMVELDSPLSELSYDEINKTLSYSYDWYDESNDFEVYRVSGKWIFTGESFEELERTTDDQHE